jgi:tRNA1Val (adenine37-N6)-methyltransferase
LVPGRILPELNAFWIIGTGTGLIALMMAQRNSQAQIGAIEIDPEAFHEAAVNVQQSPWSERIELEM